MAISDRFQHTIFALGSTIPANWQRGAGDQSNFYDYTVIRMSDLPNIYLALIAS
jgi:hypothetical protein